MVLGGGWMEEDRIVCLKLGVHDLILVSPMSSLLISYHNSNYYIQKINDNLYIYTLYSHSSPITLNNNYYSNENIPFHHKIMYKHCLRYNNISNIISHYHPSFPS